MNDQDDLLGDAVRFLWLIDDILYHTPPLYPPTCEVYHSLVEQLDSAEQAYMQALQWRIWCIRHPELR